jgi:hypothetical protein
MFGDDDSIEEIKGYKVLVEETSEFSILRSFSEKDLRKYKIYKNYFSLFTSYFYFFSLCLFICMGTDGDSLRAHVSRSLTQNFSGLLQKLTKIFLTMPPKKLKMKKPQVIYFYFTFFNH